MVKGRAVAGALLVAAGLAGATPVLANANNAAIIPQLRSEAGVPGTAGQQDAGDREFRQLFQSWRSMDKSVPLGSAQPTGGVIPGFAAARSVSIPALVPVDGTRFSSGFGMREHPVLGGRRAHKGIDLAAPTGTPIHATADGVVSRADWFSSYGLYVSLEHGGSIETRYGHMSRLNVAAGQQVHKGDIIGYVGTTGRSTGPHLHYEVRIDGDAVNPVPYLEAGEFQHPAAAQIAAADHQAQAMKGLEDDAD